MREHFDYFLFFFFFMRMKNDGNNSPLPLFNRLNVLLKMAGCSVFGFFFVLPFLRLDVTIGATQSLFFSKKRKKKKKKSESRCA